mmetsp:Transcript_15158/g.21159  ORF Transcript_15158/g.21159 Transcript_15158/m.21159 type:complete len:311 (-) Transcript_15158:15-947(-)
MDNTFTPLHPKVRTEAARQPVATRPSVVTKTRESTVTRPDPRVRSSLASTLQTPSTKTDRQSTLSSTRGLETVKRKQSLAATSLSSTQNLSSTLSSTTGATIQKDTGQATEKHLTQISTEVAVLQARLLQWIYLENSLQSNGSKSSLQQELLEESNALKDLKDRYQKQLQQYQLLQLRQQLKIIADEQSESMKNISALVQFLDYFEMLHKTVSNTMHAIPVVGILDDSQSLAKSFQTASSVQNQASLSKLLDAQPSLEEAEKQINKLADTLLRQTDELLSVMKSLETMTVVQTHQLSLQTAVDLSGPDLY